MMGKIGQMGPVIRILELKHVVDKIGMGQHETTVALQ
jgi:hypothetical protein